MNSFLKLIKKRPEHMKFMPNTIFTKELLIKMMGIYKPKDFKDILSYIDIDNLILLIDWDNSIIDYISKFKILYSDYNYEDVAIRMITRNPKYIRKIHNISEDLMKKIIKLDSDILTHAVIVDYSPYIEFCIDENIDIIEYIEANFRLDGMSREIYENNLRRAYDYIYRKKED